MKTTVTTTTIIIIILYTYMSHGIKTGLPNQSTADILCWMTLRFEELSSPLLGGQQHP